MMIFHSLTSKKLWFSIVNRGCLPQGTSKQPSLRVTQQRLIGCSNGLLEGFDLGGFTRTKHGDFRKRGGLVQVFYMDSQIQQGIKLGGLILTHGIRSFYYGLISSNKFNIVKWRWGSTSYGGLILTGRFTTLGVKSYGRTAWFQQPWG